MRIPWRSIVAVIIAILVLYVFFRLGSSLWTEITVVQATIGNSTLSPDQKYFWFARLETMKAVIGFSAVVLGLISASSAWRAAQRPE